MFFCCWSWDKGIILFFGKMQICCSNEKLNSIQVKHYNTTSRLIFMFFHLTIWNMIYPLIFQSSVKQISPWQIDTWLNVWQYWSDTCTQLLIPQIIYQMSKCIVRHHLTLSLEGKDDYPLKTSNLQLYDGCH